MSVDPLSTATIGTTHVSVTRLGLGTGPLGGWPDPVSEEDGIETIRAAWDEGLRYFDTAPLYGYGQSETWLGRVLSTRSRNEFTLSTKVGRLLREPIAREEPIFQGTGSSVRPVWDFSYDGVIRSLDESLERLHLDRVDIVLIHDPDEHLDEALEGAYLALDGLRAAGVVGAIGAGMNRTTPLTYLIRRADFDCILVAGRYTLLDQSAIDDLLPLAASKRVSIVAGGVYNSGLLVDPRPGARYNYAPATPELVSRAEAIQTICQKYGIPLRAAAIQFPLAHPAVAAVVTGSRTPAEIRENARLMAIPIPSALWEELRDRGVVANGVPVPVSP